MKTVLYLGLDEPDLSSKFIHDPKEIDLIHYPIIKIIPRSKNDCHDVLKNFLEFSHIIFTSKTSVNIVFDYLEYYSYPKNLIEQKQYIAVGANTAKQLEKQGIKNVLVAVQETAEGVIDMLKTLNLKDSYIFWPHSSLSRNTLSEYLLNENLKHKECIFYDTVPFLTEPLPCLSKVDEIVFTSPSTVDAFLSFYKALPLNKILTPIGPITKAALEKKFSKN